MSLRASSGRLEPPAPAGPRVAAVAALCFGSGVAALIYQLVWFQLLGLVIGASSISLGVLLGTFMGGMGIGSLLFSRVVGPARHPLRVLAGLEAGIALAGLALLVILPAINTLYGWIAAAAATGLPGLLLRALIAAICLLPPTLLMGATLPAVGRWFGTSAAGVARTGMCYGANIFGAVAGALAAGYWLLPGHDVIVATGVAVLCNALVALVAWRVSHAGDPVDRAAARDSAPPVEAAPGQRVTDWPVLLVAGVSGMTALAAEVIWTRHLALLLGATVYTFALVLAMFLAGLGLGSAAGARLGRRVDARVALGWCQAGLALGILWAGWSVTAALPYWPLDVMRPVSAVIALQLDLVRVAVVVLPPAVLWGMSFPLALAGLRGDTDGGRRTGQVYAANTLGAIAGALGTSLVLIVTVGSQVTQQLMVAASLAAALLLLWPWASRSLPPRRWRQGGVAATVVLGISCALAIPALPGLFVAFGRFMPTRSAGASVIYQEEGLTAPIAVTEQTNGELTYHNAGKAQASTYPQDMRLQRMLGHMTTLVPDAGRDYLVIGLGAGITAGAVALDPAAERVVIADIEPLTAVAAGEYFAAQNFAVTANPAVEITIDDGRHFLLTTRETFDGITSDPLDPWVRGAAALYTREFWQLVRSRLNPGGVVTVFVQLYETTDAAVRSELATFFDVFPAGAVFVNTIQGQGYDAVLFARHGEAPIDLERIEAKLREPRYAQVRQSLTESGFRSAVDLFATFAGSAPALAGWLDAAAINTDRNLRLQYLAGRGVNVYTADAIYRQMAGAGLPDAAGLVTGTPGQLRDLRAQIGARYGRF